MFNLSSGLEIYFFSASKPQVHYVYLEFSLHQSSPICGSPSTFLLLVPSSSETVCTYFLHCVTKMWSPILTHGEMQRDWPQAAKN